MPFPVNLHWREDSIFSPPAESWLVNLNFPRSSLKQGLLYVLLAILGLTLRKAFQNTQAGYVFSYN